MLTLRSMPIDGLGQSVDSLERSVEFRLHLHGLPRMLWRIFVVLGANAVGCLLVIGSTRVFEILVQSTSDGILLRPLERLFDILDGVVAVAFVLSAVVITLRTVRRATWQA